MVSRSVNYVDSDCWGIRYAPVLGLLRIGNEGAETPKGEAELSSAPCRRRVGVPRRSGLLGSSVRAVLTHAYDGSKTPKGWWGK